MSSETTKAFQDELARVASETLGVKVSRAKAWALYKNTTNATVEFVANQKDTKLSLAGIGRFYINKSKPRGMHGKKPALEGKVPFIPHFRWRPSDTIKNKLLLKLCKFDAKAEKEKAAK